MKIYLQNIIYCMAYTFLSSVVYAQPKFNLQQCIQYAIENNISIKQNKVKEMLAAITFKQSKLSSYPSANFSNNDGYRFGKSQNPSTGILENQNYFSISLNFQSSVEIFSWFAKRNTILANQWQVEATKATTDKIKNDISLTIINAYLQIMLAYEQEKIAEVQVQQSNIQLISIQKKVSAGALPELNAVELQSQLASDSANLIAAKGNAEQAKYILKGYMNMDANVPFEIEETPVDNIVTKSIADLQPETIYAIALANLPQQKINEYNLKAALANSKAAKGAMYPSISAYGSLGTNYGYYKTPVYQQVFSGYQSSGLVIPNGGGGYTDVQRPVFTNGDKNGYFTSAPIGSQFNNNFGQSIGINISVPIFNGWSAKANYEKSKLNIRNAELQKEADDKITKQNIYQAFNAAVVAIEKFNASQKAVSFAQRSFDFATKRYNVGMLTTLELITDQNNLFKAKLESILNRFDYIFKVKILEFYKQDDLK